MLPKLKIATPCLMDWEEMSGTNQQRFCSQCNLHVQNLEAMTKPQILRVLQSRGERTCARVRLRADGTVVPRAVLAPPRGWWSRLVRLATAALAVMFAVSPATAQVKPEFVAPEPVVRIENKQDYFNVRVLDQLAEPVKNAVVELQDSQNHTLSTVTTDRKGRAHMPRPASGTYVLLVSAPLMMTYSRLLAVDEEVVSVEANTTVLVGILIDPEPGIPVDFPFATGPRDIRQPQGNKVQ